MKSKLFSGLLLCGITCAVLALGTVGEVAAYPHHGGHRHGEHEHINPRDIDGKVHVINETDFDMYVTCDGRNLGRVSGRSSEEFVVKCGEQYFSAEIEGCRAGKDADIDPRRRHGEVTFSPSDFSHLPDSK